MTVRTNTNLGQIRTVLTQLTNTSATTVYEPQEGRRDVVHTIALHNSNGSSITGEIYFRTYASGSAVDVRIWRNSVNGHATEIFEVPLALVTRQSTKDAIRVVGDNGINVVVTAAAGGGQ